MPSKPLQTVLSSVVLLIGIGLQAQDLHIKKNILVGGNFTSSAETSIKGARERTVTQTQGGTTVTLKQCDLKRTLTLNDQTQTYMVANDPQDENAAKAAALATGAQAPEATGGKIVITTTVTDTGERKTMYGYPARHLKAKVVQEPSEDACTKVKQSFEIDGWFADVSKELLSCASIAPPLQQAAGCQDRIIARRVGSGKLGYPLQENITMPTPDGGTMSVGIQISEISKQELSADLFDVPAGYRQVNSVAELNGLPTAQSQVAQQAMPQQQVPQQAQQAYVPPAQPAANAGHPSMAQMMFNPGAQVAMQQAAMAQAQQAGMMNPQAMGAMNGMQGAGQPAAAPIAAPQQLGPKAPGKIRIGVAPPDAQVGQGSNTGADYSTPIRNAEVALMNGPAIEIAALDSHIPMQLQAEAQQKQCDFILYSSVAVKHASSGGFGKFAKMAGPMASMTPIGAMAHGMGGAVAASAASAAASAAAQSAQQQAMNQLAGFNGQIKSKDDVTVQYQLVGTGQSSPILQNTLKAKAKSDGEDVLTPLLQQTATSVLDQASKK
ncbi:MAG TPA: hypothetical protein VHR84_15000 [Terriglobales bacterium]|jgi:hypothetical protein|nr:hypothetical protein [Terriglobales bacterium]